MSKFNLFVLSDLKKHGREVEINLRNGIVLVGVVDELKDSYMILDETTAMGDMVVIEYSTIDSFSVIENIA